MNVTIRAVEGRVAYLDPQCKKPVPHDRWITVPETAQLRRLIDVHGDVEEQSATVTAAPATPATAETATTGTVSAIAEIQAAAKAAK